MRVFLDTNVLASALGTRGLCADVLRLVLAEHDLIIAEPVIEELRTVLRRKLAVPAAAIREVESFLRSYHVEPQPGELPQLPLRDHPDLVIIASALAAKAEFFLTGDRELLEVGQKPEALRIMSPRDFWNFTKATLKTQSLRRVWLYKRNAKIRRPI